MTARIYVGDTLRTGRGLFTREAIPPGVTAFVSGGPARAFASVGPEGASSLRRWLGVLENAPSEPDPYLDALNSCEPNLGISGAWAFVALRDVAPGEELTVDYSITRLAPRWEMECDCGSARCRRLIRPVQFLSAKDLSRYLPLVPPLMVAAWEDAAIEAMRKRGRAVRRIR